MTALLATRRQYLLYVCLYFGWGLYMHKLGGWLQIAEFAHWWQVITCYVFCLVPASLAVRSQPLLAQYLFGLLTLAPIEILGYALGTSIVYENNILDRVFGPRNFSLCMTVFFAGILPLGNLAVQWLEQAIWSEGGQPAPD